MARRKGLNLEAEVETLRGQVRDLRGEVRRLTQALAAAEAKHTRFLPNETRQQIISLLKRGDLSDREIGRRCGGVSPTTIGKYRRELKGE